MIVFHGTTWRNAMYIYINGFIPIRPAKAVWFTKNKPYARRRARHKAHTADSRPIVLTCNLDLDALRQELGPNKVRVRNPQIISIAGPVPPSVLVSRTLLEICTSPKI